MIVVTLVYIVDCYYSYYRQVVTELREKLKNMMRKR